MTFVGPTPSTIARMGKTATEILRDNIRRLMDARGWSEPALSKKSGVSQSRINYLLNYRDTNDRHPSTLTVEQIATAFGLQAWQLMCPVEAQPVPEPLDAELLRDSIREAADAYRSRGMLIDDERLAGAAAFLYRRVRDGLSLRSATDVVKQELLRFGPNLAIDPDGEKLGKEPRGPAEKGVVRRGSAGTGRDTRRKGNRSKAKE